MDCVAIFNVNCDYNSPKEFARFKLSDQNGNLRTLSVAVNGGSKKLRTFKYFPNISLSDHGNWRQNHLKTMEALLGKKPFYEDASRVVSDAFLNLKNDNLYDLNTAILNNIFAFLLENITFEDLKACQNSHVLIERGKEILKGLDPEISVVQAIAKNGKETILALLAMMED